MKKTKSVARRGGWTVKAALRSMGGMLAALSLHASLPALHGSAEADSRPKKIIVLRSGDLPYYSLAVKEFVDTLRARNVLFAVEDRTLPREEERGAFLQELQAGLPDLVFTVGTPATIAVFQKKTLPFVYAMIMDPPALGVNTGGAVMETPPSIQLDFLRAHFPSFKRVGVIHSSTRNADYVRLLKETRTGECSIVEVVADTPQELDRAISSLVGRADCLLMIPDSQLYSPQFSGQIILQTIRLGLPLIGVSPSYARAGALAAVYPDYGDNGAVAADVAAQYFGGQALSSIPPQWPRRTRYAVNLIVAERLGVPVDEKILDGADEVVR
jgi:ABC-type uncharacterized transport system substrate-binding protein